MTLFRQKRLILCLHDVSPREYDRVREVDDFYQELGVGPNYAMLVVPDFHGRWSIEDNPKFSNWLKERARAGVEILLHGYYHQDTTPADMRALKTRFGYVLLGEGEYAAIEELEALKRLARGRALLEEMLDQKIDGFVAPAWQYSSGARAALEKLGFEIAENRLTVWSPKRGCLLTKSPVIAYSGRDMFREASSLLWSRISTRLLKPCNVVRHAIHPADFDSKRLIDEIRRSLSGLMADRRIVRYRQLLTAPAV